VLVDVFPSIPKKTPAGLPLTLVGVLFITCDAFVDIGKLPPDFVDKDVAVPITPLFESDLDVCRFCGAGKLKAIIKYSHSLFINTPSKDHR
jgi:hypothetical protein